MINISRIKIKVTDSCNFNKFTEIVRSTPVIKMKVKKSNQVEARQNHKRKEIGQIVTRLLKNLKETSAENVVGVASRHLNRSSAQIFPAVQRTLNYGVRNGFIIKRGNKFSLSSKQNYETDNDKYGGRYKKHPIGTVDEILTGRDSAYHLKTCKRHTKICEATSTVEQCNAMDLITFGRCNYKKWSQQYDLCEHHQILRIIFQYKKFFFINLERILPLYAQFNVTAEIRSRTAILQFYHARANVIDSYVQFLENYFCFIFQENDDPTNDELIKEILLCKQQLRNANGKCFGVNLEDGRRCSGRRWNNSPHCEVHYTLHTFHKLFSHASWIGDGLHPGMVLSVFNIQNRVEDHFSDEEKEILLALPSCLMHYVAMVTRLEDRAISKFPVEGFERKMWVLLAQAKNKINSSVDENVPCLCQCSDEDAFARFEKVCKMPK